VRIQQNFQEIEVEAWLKGKPVTVSGARLAGDAIAWDMQGARFQGRVEGARIVSDAVVLTRAPR
jgi:hypothetical protein